MATVNRFEDLEIWKLSRELCKEIYIVIETTDLKNNFRLCNQIDSSSGSIMDNIAEGLSETEIRNLFSFYQSRKHLVEKHDHSCTVFLIEISFHRINLNA